MLETRFTKVITVSFFISYPSVFCFLCRTGSAAIGAGFQAFITDWQKITATVINFSLPVNLFYSTV